MAETVKHVVMAKFKDDISAEQQESLIKGFHSLPAVIHHIKAFEWGTDISVENRHQGFTHVFVLTFESPQGRDAYLVHPAHEEFATEIIQALDKLVVFDYKPSPVECA